MYPSSLLIFVILDRVKYTTYVAHSLLNRDNIISVFLWSLCQSSEVRDNLVDTMYQISAICIFFRMWILCVCMCMIKQDGLSIVVVN